MHLTTDNAQLKAPNGIVKVFCNGKLVDKAFEAMTGKNGFVNYYLQPIRIIGDCAQTASVRGNVTAVFE